VPIVSRPAGESRPPDDSLATALRGFGPIGLLAVLVILAGNFIVVPLSALLVLAWARLSRTPWRALGFVRPGNWLVCVVVGVAFGVVFKLAMKALVMPLLGADPINQAYHHLVGNAAAMPAMLYLAIVGAGFGEEVLWRGWMFERLGAALGSGARATIAIVLITSALFGLAHYPEQGLAGMEQATIFGLVFGGIFAVTGRIWPLIFAHAAFDLTALALIYWDLETQVARSILG
jgi:uncharacterized protein